MHPTHPILLTVMHIHFILFHFTYLFIFYFLSRIILFYLYTYSPRSSAYIHTHITSLSPLLYLPHLLYPPPLPGQHAHSPPDTTTRSPHRHTPLHTCFSSMWSLTKHDSDIVTKPHVHMHPPHSFNFQHRATPQ